LAESQERRQSKNAFFYGYDANGRLTGRTNAAGTRTL